MRSYEGEKVTDKWASLHQVIASDLDNLMLAVVILQFTELYVFRLFIKAIVAIHYVALNSA
jgi:hypothetical protein